MYPIIITQSRYSGTYEGGKWFAYHSDIPLTLAYYDYIDGDDCYAVDFWNSDESRLFGIGDTPNEALEDMYKKNPPTRTSLD
jgi:hypothetical protein